MTKKSSKKKLEKNTKQLTQQIKAARKAALSAYAPYSGATIGASVLTKSGDIHSGCNVENSSYGATMCAERVAIFSAVAAAGNKTKKSSQSLISEICIVSPGNIPWPPCGMCRQVLSEFASSSTKIHLANLKGAHVETYEFGDLFPMMFEKKFLRSQQDRES